MRTAVRSLLIAASIIVQSSPAVSKQRLRQHTAIALSDIRDIIDAKAAPGRQQPGMVASQVQGR